MQDHTRFSLRDGFELSGLGVDELWWRYFALQGEADPRLLLDRIAGIAPCDDAEHDLIAQALNEAFLDRGFAVFPVGYTDACADVDPRPAAALSVSPSDARRRAEDARKRGAEAARRAAALHLTASQLMLASGQLRYAQQARERVTSAWERGAAAAV